MHIRASIIVCTEAWLDTSVNSTEKLQILIHNEMDEEELLRLEEVEIKYEALSSDDVRTKLRHKLLILTQISFQEYEFQFEVDDQEYDEVVRDLKAKDSDLEELEDEVKINCPLEGCKKAFSRRHNLIKHLKSHEMGLDKPGSICHICGKTIKGVYSLHLKVHENSKQFRCDDCGKEFRQKVALQNHRKSLNLRLNQLDNRETSFQC